MRHELTVWPTDRLAAAAANYVADTVIRHTRNGHRFHMAVSGGATPWAMYAALAVHPLPWALITLYQVDERVAPDGDPARNLTNLVAALGTATPTITPMPVTDPDLAAAAQRYGAALPERFDLVHLGLGPDGHTASLVPHDPVLAEQTSPVGLTASYQGHPRMTLTYPGLRRANQLLWLVAGGDKASALASLLAGDVSIPAGRVVAAASTVFADEAARP